MGFFKGYVINEEIFQNKNEITERCREIVASNIGKDLEGTDLAFIIQLFKYHPDPDKLMCAKRIFVSDDKYHKNNCFYVEYLGGGMDDISWTKCITHIPWGEEYPIEWNMPFGKYKDWSLHEIYMEDRSYLRWLANQDIDRGLKVKVNQILRYGHIPYNPIAHKHAKQRGVKIEEKPTAPITDDEVVPEPTYDVDEPNTSTMPDEYFTLDDM